MIEVLENTNVLEPTQNQIVCNSNLAGLLIGVKQNMKCMISVVTDICTLHVVAIRKFVFTS